MATTTAHYGWGNPANGDGQGASELLITGTIDAIDADVWGVSQASGLTGYFAPLTTGDPASPELVFDGDGQVVMVWVAL